MLKGHVFKEQVFGNQIFALFINTFLNGHNGISNNYKNGMKVTYSGSTLTVQSGAICIQGRLLEEDSNSSVTAGTDTAYCKLVLEIDLSKQNTAEEFNQGTYKIVKSTSGYPNLTQNDIVKNNTGVYQYELARFKTGATGISEFQDMRTFLDFESIYDEVDKKIQEIEDRSIFVLKEDINIITAYVIEDTIAVTGDNQTILLKGIKKAGNKFNLSTDGGVVIGEGINNVKITGAIFFQEFEKGNGYFFPQIRKNGSPVSAVIEQKGLNGSAGFQTVNFSNFLLEVQAGDIITLNSGDINQTPCKVRGGSTITTFLTVEAVD